MSAFDDLLVPEFDVNEEPVLTQAFAGQFVFVEIEVPGGIGWRGKASMVTLLSAR